MYLHFMIETDRYEDSACAFNGFEILLYNRVLFLSWHNFCNLSLLERLNIFLEKGNYISCIFNKNYRKKLMWLIRYIGMQVKIRLQS